MKRNPHLAVLGAAAALLAAGASEASEVRERSTRTWDARGVTAVDVANPQGLVAVRASRDGRIHLEAIKLARDGDDREVRQLAAQTRVEAAAREGRLTVRVHYPERKIRLSVWDLLGDVNFARVEVRLALEVPPALLTTLHSSSGDLETAGLTGSQRIESSSGDISVADAGGAVDADTRSGDVLLADVSAARIGTGSGDVDVESARGPLHIQTGSGTIRIGLSSEPLVASTSSGDVSVGEARGGARVSSTSGEVTLRSSGSVEVETASGSARITLAAPVARANVSTASGDVTLRLDRTMGCRVDLQSENGSIDVRVAADVRSLSERHLIATIGNGTVPVVLRSSSGNLNVVQ